MTDFQISLFRIEYREYLFSRALDFRLATNKFKVLGSNFILCNKFVNIWQVGMKKCTGVLHLHIGREASDTIMYKQPRRELCYAESHQYFL
jgi:hypothetical protein